MVDKETFWETELARLVPDPEQALEEALQYVCCPICYVLADLPFEFFRQLPQRWSEDPALRNVISTAGGFCNNHTWRLMGMQSQLAIARVFVDVLRVLAEEGAAPTQALCPVCHLQALATEQLLEAFGQRLAMPKERERYQQLLGLCYPHFRALLQRDLPPEVTIFLQATQRAVTEALQADLQGFLDKANVALKHTRTVDEQRAPRRALIKTAGNEGL